jgi:hypothetical protein
MTVYCDWGRNWGRTQYSNLSTRILCAVCGWVLPPAYTAFSLNPVGVPRLVLRPSSSSGADSFAQTREDASYKRCTTLPKKCWPGLCTGRGLWKVLSIPLICHQPSPIIVQGLCYTRLSRDGVGPGSEPTRGVPAHDLGAYLSEHSLRDRVYQHHRTRHGPGPAL